MLEWLFFPVDSSRVHNISDAAAMHGRLMTLAWGFAVPLGIIVARFFKILPSQKWPSEVDNRFWWHSHRALHYVAGAFTLVGLFIVVQGLTTLGSSGNHAVFGWALILLMLGQFLGGWLRGSKGGPTDSAPDGSLHGDHYSMTRRRVVFEWCHKIGGYLALCMACLALLSGLWRTNAPNWMWLGLAVWWTVLLGLAITLQARGRAYDTYQAIWGDDPSHPGSARKPIGFGISKPSKWKV